MMSAARRCAAAAVVLMSLGGCSGTAADGPIGEVVSVQSADGFAGTLLTDPLGRARR